MTKRAATGVSDFTKKTAKGVTNVTKSVASEASNFGGSAFKKMVNLIDESEESEQENTGPQTEEQAFVKTLYEKVHT